MHEASLMIHLLRRVELETRAAGALRARAIRLRAGTLAGVEPLLLESAFRDLSPGTLAEGAALKIDVVPLIASCDDCRRHFEVEAFRFACPTCGGGRTRVIAGEHLILEEITVVDAPVSSGAQP